MASRAAYRLHWTSSGSPHRSPGPPRLRIIRRDESAVSGQSGSPHEVWYRFAGRQLGYTGNNGTSDISYQASIDERRTVQPTNPGTYRNGQLYGVSYADFAQNYDPINSYYQGASGGTYRVQQGDSLQGIAQSLWGDSSLWYKLAEANGMSASGGLIEGQTLILPTGVMRSKHNAGTTNPYNPADAIGDLSPTAPQPPKKAKCGGFGMVLLAIISVAVSFVLPAVAPAIFGGFWGGVGAAVVGSIVSQGVGVATGIQEKFSFKGVALAALSAGIGAGVGDVLGKGAMLGSKFVGDVVRGAVASAVTQGVAVATGLQDKFDWVGVAAAGIGSGIGGAVSRALPGGATFNSSGELTKAASFGNNLGSSMADAIASAATRSALEGSSFGDNLVEAMPSAIGNTLGRVLGIYAAEEIQLMSLNGIDGLEDYTRDQKLEAVSLMTQLDLAGEVGSISARDIMRRNRGSVTVLMDAVNERLDPTTPQRARAASLNLVREFGGERAARDVEAAFQYLPQSDRQISFRYSEPSIGSDLLSAGASILSGVGRTIGYINDNIEARPWLKYGLIALDIATGPIAFAAREVISRTPVGDAITDGAEIATEFIQTNLVNAGLDPEEAGWAAVGAVTIGAIAVGGALRSLPVVRRAMATFRNVTQRLVNLGAPNGFWTRGQYSGFTHSTRSHLEAAGYGDGSFAFLGGSAVTGVRSQHARPNPVTGEPMAGTPFDYELTSDFDLAIGGPELVRRAQEIGVRFNDRGQARIPLTPEQLDRLGLTTMSQSLTRQAGGRHVSLMIFQNREAVLNKPGWTYVSFWDK